MIIRPQHLIVAFGLLLLPGRAAHAAGPVIWLDSLDVDTMTQDFGSPRAKASVDGNPITLGSKMYAHGVGTHANSVYRIRLDEKAERFEATVGVDDETKGHGSVTFNPARTHSC